MAHSHLMLEVRSKNWVMKLRLQWLLPLISNPAAYSEVRRIFACMPTEAGRIMPWICCQVEDCFQLLCRCNNLWQRGGLESHLKYSNRAIEDPKTGKRKKLEIAVSCDAEAWRKPKDLFLKLLELSRNNSFQTKTIFLTSVRYKCISNNIKYVTMKGVPIMPDL